MTEELPASESNSTRPGFTPISTGMDIQRPDIKRKQVRRRRLTIAAVIVVLGGITWWSSRLEPAAPSIERGTVMIETVKRGEMLRQVRGNGTLVPEELLFVQAEGEGRVERLLVLPGAAVKADTILLELSNPDLEQQAFDLEWQVKGAEAGLRRLKVQLESERLTQEVAVQKLKKEVVQARLEAEADLTLAKAGLVPELTKQRSTATAEQLGNQLKAEEKRLAISADSTDAQLAVQQAEIEKLRAALALKQKKVTGLKVRAGVEGVLQQLGEKETLQVGQRVSASSTLAKIVQPSRLKAELKISETQAKDIELGQIAIIDTRNGFVPGHVVRIDPAAVQGTVTVDVKLEGALPKGARPDLSVDGTVELERLKDVLYVGRPVQAQPESTVGVFRVDANGRDARRIPVKFGRHSVSTMVVLEGLSEGDRIIVSDMNQWDAHARVTLK